MRRVPSYGSTSVPILTAAGSLRYYASDKSSDPAAVNIGTDVDPYDGTRLNYTFNTFDPKLYFWAVAENEFGNAFSNTILVIYDPNFVPPGSGGVVSVAPYLGYDGSFYTLESGVIVTIRWSDVPADTVRVDFYLWPGGTGSTPSLIGSEAFREDPVKSSRKSLMS